MTIASAVSKVTLNGNGSTTSFPFGFKVWKAADLEVSITDASGVVSVVTNWGVALNPSGGGTVAYPTSGPPLPTGHKITIARSMDFLQDVDLVSGTRWDPEVVETALDRATAERQQLKERLDRAVAVPISSSTTPEQFADELFTARDDAVASASSAATSATTAQVAANSVGVLSASGTLTTGQDTITLPWSYDTGTGNIAVFLGGVKQLRSTLTFLTSTTVQIGAAVTENTPYEVTSVTLSAESVLTGLRDQCVAAKTGAETARTGAETARTGAETAEANALSHLNTLLAVVSPDIGKYSIYPISRSTYQTLAVGAEVSIASDANISGTLSATKINNVIGWTVPEDGTYNISMEFSARKDAAVSCVLYVYIKRNTGGTADYIAASVTSLADATSWYHVYTSAPIQLLAGDLVFVTAKAEGAEIKILADSGRAILTRLR